MAMCFNAKRRGEGKGCVVLATVAVIGILVLLCLKPEVFRTPAQVPVGVSVRASLVGIGNVVQVRNMSNTMRTGVVIVGRSNATNQTATHRIGNLGAGQMAEAGWMQWNWVVAPDETITIHADGYLPIAFTADQLGIRRR